MCAIYIYIESCLRVARYNGVLSGEFPREEIIEGSVSLIEKKKEKGRNRNRR